MAHVYSQAAEALFMIRPASFGYNSQTADSNAFQESPAAAGGVAALARAEFDAFVAKLSEHKIQTIVLEDHAEPKKPDAVFPNNWVSFHNDGSVVFYPMMAPNRRLERREDVVSAVEGGGFKAGRVVDLSHYESENKFLESTGSVVFDYTHRIGYANFSPRTHPEVLKELSSLLSIDIASFNAVDRQGQAIYHTNVLLSIGDGFALVCDEAIKNIAERKKVLNRLKTTGHEIVHLTYSQLYAFAGNMIQAKNSEGKKFLLLSTTALRSLKSKQIETLEKFSTLLPIDVPTIEKYGGGSVRCMVANIHLPRSARI